MLCLFIFSISHRSRYKLLFPVYSWEYWGSVAQNYVAERAGSVSLVKSILGDVMHWISSSYLSVSFYSWFWSSSYFRNIFLLSTLLKINWRLQVLLLLGLWMFVCITVLMAAHGWGCEAEAICLCIFLLWASRRMDRTWSDAFALGIEMMNWGYGCYHGSFYSLISFEK